MDPITFSSSAYSSFKVAKDVFNFLLGQKIDAEVRAKIVEAQQAVGEAQDTMFALREQLSNLQSQNIELKSKLAEAESWANQAANYKLIETPGGAVVHFSSVGINHYACPTCFARREIHPLQRGYGGLYLCQACKSNYQIQPEPHMEPLAPTRWVP